MKTRFLFLFFLAAASGFAQQKENCRDIVYLTDGSVFRGKISSYQQDGELAMVSWSGGSIRLASINVKKIEQKCGDENPTLRSLAQRPYTFGETGWYHATRGSILWSSNGMGFGLQHSSGMKFNRLIGAGIGVGIENLTVSEDDVSTYPLFLEARGYLSAKNITPFYTLGIGWAFAGTENYNIEGEKESWEGGWMGQTQIGYRIGNHFTAHLGLRFQQKTRTWSNLWGIQGVDKILQKRFEIGLGILL